MSCILCGIVDEVSQAVFNCPQCKCSLMCYNCNLNVNHCVLNCKQLEIKKNGANSVNVYKKKTCYCSVQKTKETEHLHTAFCHFKKRSQNSLQIIENDQSHIFSTTLVEIEVVCGPYGNNKATIQTNIFDTIFLKANEDGKVILHDNEMKNIFDRLVRRTICSLEVGYGTNNLMIKIFMESDRKRNLKSDESAIWENSFEIFSIENMKKFLLSKNPLRKSLVIKVCVFGDIPDNNIFNTTVNETNTTTNFRQYIQQYPNINVRIRYKEANGNYYFEDLQNVFENNKNAFNVQAIKKCKNKNDIVFEKENDFELYKIWIRIVGSVRSSMADKKLMGKHKLYTWDNWMHRTEVNIDNYLQVFQCIFKDSCCITLDVEQIQKSSSLENWSLQCFPPTPPKSEQGRLVIDFEVLMILKLDYNVQPTGSSTYFLNEVLKKIESIS